MSPADLFARLTAAATLKDAVRAARDCARSDTPEPMPELFEWADESGDAHALFESAEESRAAVGYYAEHETHPLPRQWRDVFAEIYVREVRRRDRAALARYHAKERAA